jgi:penicillin-binding protein 1A
VRWCCSGWSSRTSSRRRSSSGRCSPRCRPARDIRPPVEDTRYPYFTSWVKQQVVDKLGGGQEGARRAFDEGLTVQTTLDSRLQDAAEDAVDGWLPNRDGPRAALVALKNDTGEVLAMVGGDDYAERPFNLATQGSASPAPRSSRSSSPRR